MRKMVGILMVVITLLVAAGCEEYQQYATAVPRSPGDLTQVAIIFNDAPEPVQATARAIALERYGTAQAAESLQDQAAAAKAIAETTRVASQVVAERQYTLLTADAHATEQAHQREMEQKWQWATQQASNATQCAQATQQAVSVQLTQQAVAAQATAEEWNRQTTATAEAVRGAATATAVEWELRTTATAQMRADQATATQRAWDERQTATAESWQATQQIAHSTMTRQAEKRETVLGYGRDYGIPVVLLVIGGGLSALIWYGFQELKSRPVVMERSLLGDAQPMAVKDSGGGWSFIDLDRQPGHVTRLLASGEAQAPRFREAGQEERTTARDQGVDGMTRPRLGGGHQQRQVELPAPPQARPEGLTGVRVLRRLDQATQSGLLPPGQVEAIEAVWQEEE